MGTGRKYILIACETRLEQRGTRPIYAFSIDVAVPAVEIIPRLASSVDGGGRVAEKNGENGCITFERW